MKAFHCNGCGRRMGLTPNRLPGYTYCEPWCASDFEISKHEERDALLVELSRTRPLAWVARAMGLSRQRVQQLTTARAV